MYIPPSHGIDLAQYREMEVFTQFSSDLDKTTKELLEHGKHLVEFPSARFNPPPLGGQALASFK